MLVERDLVPDEEIDLLRSRTRVTVMKRSEHRFSVVVLKSAKLSDALLPIT